MKTLKKIYFKIFKKYRRTDFRACTWEEGDALLRANVGKPESEQWRIADEENGNRLMRIVYLERRVRVLS